MRALGRPEGGDVVATMPGYGARPTHEADLRPAMPGARLAAERLADLSAPVVVLGHSASCQIVAQAACRCPGQVSALVLVGPTTDPRASSWPQIGRRWLRTAMWERPGQIPLLARTYSRTGPLWMFRAMDAARRDDVRVSLRQVDCPVVVIRGRHDRICPPDWAAELVDTAPSGSRMVTLDKGAHMVPLTEGELLASALTRAVL